MDWDEYWYYWTFWQICWRTPLKLWTCGKTYTRSEWWRRHHERLKLPHHTWHDDQGWSPECSFDSDQPSRDTKTHTQWQCSWIQFGDNVANIQNTQHFTYDDNSIHTIREWQSGKWNWTHQNLDKDDADIIWFNKKTLVHDCQICDIHCEQDQHVF